MYLSNPYYFTGCLNIQFFDSSPFPNTVSEATLGILPLTVQHLCDLRTPCHVIGHQVLPNQVLPREAGDFPRGDRYPKQ